MNKASYFWLEERDILPGNGFTLWGSSHKMVIVVILFFIAVSIIAFERVKGRYKELIMRSLAVLLPLLEVLKIAVLSAHGRMDIGHLPIHLCSIAIYIRNEQQAEKGSIVPSFLDSNDTGQYCIDTWMDPV